MLPEDDFVVSLAKSHLKKELGSKVRILDVSLFDFEHVLIMKIEKETSPKN